MKTLQIIGILLEVVLIFNLLIIVHELGHFLAARWRGLVVEGFGIWFGKPIWQKKINGVVYSLGCIPAGGFVKLPQMAPMESIEGESEIPKEQLKPISALDKIIVAFAGPLFSFGLAAVFAVVVYFIGRPVTEIEKSTVIGYMEPTSAAAQAGLKVGDKIVEVDGHKVSRFMGMGGDTIQWRVVRSEGETIPIVAERTVNGAVERVQVSVKPVIPATKAWERKQLRQIQVQPSVTQLVGLVEPGSAAEKAGVKKGDHVVAVGGQKVYSFADISNYLDQHPNEPLAITIDRGGNTFDASFPVLGATIGEVHRGSPAEKAGLKKGDRVVGVDGKPNSSTYGISTAIQAHGEKPLTLQIERSGTKQDISVTPAIPEGQEKPFIGIAWTEDHGGMKFDARGVTVLDNPGPLAQLRKAAGTIFDTIGAIASRKSGIGIGQLGGPVVMMQVYYNMFDDEFANGWRRALWFSVVINVNLALMNMLPIPVLDGGHITIAILEAIRRRPVSLRILEPIQTACALLLIGFMLFVTFYDVQNLPFFGGNKGLKFKPTPAATQPK